MSHQRITIQRLTLDELAGQEWVFWYFDDHNVLVIDSYRTMERKSKRHKFQAVDYYRRLGRDHMDRSISEEDVPLPPDVAKEAKEAYIAKLRVCRWEDRFPK